MKTGRDSFPDNTDPDIDVRVRMININPKHSAALLKPCRPLSEYSWFIDRIRENRKTMFLRDAIDEAINSVPEDFLIRDLLLENRSEVSDMLETEFNEEEVLKIVALNAEKRGEKKGKKLGEKQAESKLTNLFKKLVPGSEEYYQALDATHEELEQLYVKYNIPLD